MQLGDHSIDGEQLKRLGFSTTMSTLATRSFSSISDLNAPRARVGNHFEVVRVYLHLMVLLKFLGFYGNANSAVDIEKFLGFAATLLLRCSSAFHKLSC
ncbi:hypothetical protein PHPALM_4380 [Phytophthora palmivora]|uniref:Uncharacterized protein n=1 Tax=Phytophthora palmivora TaxID=4796 RepID=A0A2P4YJZ7_9STRA|nr:hypothetical protein PHPALM_4380 [Phytophthora palmivora]